ncbi:DUF547 domain-containing protein [Candidatus Accumulibacter vicinus]|uniref:DUF547 domain-containing protein n=1 Tax=Candidatus Accumulibacter vicinus TaxID=2954382 RepID=A0A084XU07_9PROT|nr:DUF547 domain-containing protein [Candidatus Accumulibacter vicinus]KFB65951.1 MAG: hypothetical protein CAPSK01_004790 [Candidatus Accumulibacter vicinus]
MMSKRFFWLAAWLTLFIAGPVQAFDHTHRSWNDLLVRHVVVSKEGYSSAVRYAGMQSDRAALKRYLTTLEEVSPRDYESWNKGQQLAFLINAYNAWTVELVLQKYPDLKSIKDLGSTFRSPWKKKFFTLLGQERSLDDVEHGMIRAAGKFDEPRIHFAVVCASIGCPMLLPSAFVAEKLEAQLEEGMRRFLSDRSRNRFEAASGKMKISRIFDWYGKDFAQGHQGMTSVKAALARHANVLADSAADIRRVQSGDYEIEFLDYDWRLNDARQSG